MNKKVYRFVFYSLLSILVLSRTANALENPKGVLYWERKDKTVELHIYSPSEKRDMIFLVLGNVPSLIKWSMDMKSMYYRAGPDVFKAEWKCGARPKKLFRMPSEALNSSFTITWVDKATKRWRTAYVIEDLRKLDVTIVKEHGRERYYMIHEKEKILIEKEYYARYGGLAIVKEYVAGQGWRTLAKRSTACNAQSDPCLEVIQNLMDRLEMRTHGELRVSMRIQNYLDSVQWITGNSHRGVAYLPSGFIKNRGLKVKVDTGDTEHANAPLIYVNKDSGEEKVIYEADENCYSFSQIGFAEHDGFLLVGTEYRSECSRVIDMRTGEIVLDLPSKSSAVWVEVPKRFVAAASGS